MAFIRAYLKWGLLALIAGAALWFAFGYAQWQRDRQEAQTVARAVKYAVEQISPAYLDFVRKYRKAPQENIELGLPPARDSLWFGFSKVQVHPNGDVHFEFAGHDPKQQPLLVWRIGARDRAGSAGLCGSRDIQAKVLAWNGLRCDADVAIASKDAPIPSLANLPSRTLTPADEVLEAVRRNDPSALSVLRQQGHDICAANAEGLAPLIEAVRGSQLKIIPELITAHCDVNQLEPFSGRSGLMVAAVGRNVELVRDLLSAGVDPNLKTKEGDSAWFLLGIGGDDGSQRIRQMLLVKGVDINTRAADESTLLMRAAGAGNPQLIEWLLLSGAHIDLQDRDGRSALMYATLAERDAGALQALIGRGAQINLKDAQGKTPLALALTINDVQRQKRVVNALQAAGGKV